ncbi:MAG: P1 family peptidase, partial [Caulobacteraceae bacterium]
MTRRTVLGSMAAAMAAASASNAEAQGGPARPGPRNLITDVPGLKVGQSQDAAVRSGVTVILPDSAAVCAVDVRGGGPATRETDALSPQNLVQEVDAIVLSGGSVYGLASADAVTAWLGAHDRGFQMMPSPGVPRSPIVPTACLYDLANGGKKGWGTEPPYRRLATQALEAAGDTFALGTAGAGYG